MQACCFRLYFLFVTVLTFAGMELHAFISCQYFDTHFIDFKMLLSVRVDGARVAENLRLVWVHPESHFLSCFLEFTHHFPFLFFGNCEQHHVVGKSQVREAVMIMVAQVYSIPFSLPSLNFVLQRVFKDCAEQQPDHLALILSGCRKCCSLRQSLQKPFGLRISSSRGCSRGRCCKI